ncbi:hypothetical protein N7457_008202 [Penicillium paradoxum]|uniref:uncharacterized protein n=1 Tax=Penicillium paradoxum TaxID=176176 RepID=UPI002547E7EC|nr:uncharacterized protein N7457_008202 [Penicillium paradoxum]KAJ5773306.1 hypothetical protein N7457_008202 [Penicillium paradoxum]
MTRRKIVKAEKKVSPQREVLAIIADKHRVLFRHCVEATKVEFNFVTTHLHLTAQAAKLELHRIKNIFLGKKPKK